MTQDTLKHILNVLRQGTIKWRGRSDCLKRSRKKVWDGQLFKNGKKKYKFFWQCAACKEWFKNESDLEVDHVVEIGEQPKELSTIIEYIERMYPEDPNALQALCCLCHKRKTSKFNASLLFKRKANRDPEL